MECRTRTILEIAGFPENHVKEVMEKVQEELKKEKNIKVLKEEIEPPKKINEYMWSTFVELELEFKTPAALTNFCFEYMPSSIEILDINQITFKTSEYNAVLNDMLARIHELNLQLNHLNASLRAIKSEKPTPSQNSE